MKKVEVKTPTLSKRQSKGTNNLSLEKVANVLIFTFDILLIIFFTLIIDVL